MRAGYFRRTFDLLRNLNCELIKNYATLENWVNAMSLVFFFVMYVTQPLPLFFSECLLLTSADSHVNEKELNAFSFLMRASITRLALPLLVSRFSYATSLTSYLSISRRREGEEHDVKKFSWLSWAQIWIESQILHLLWKCCLIARIRRRNMIFFEM